MLMLARLSERSESKSLPALSNDQAWVRLARMHDFYMTAQVPLSEVSSLQCQCIDGLRYSPRILPLLPGLVRLAAEVTVPLTALDDQNAL